MNSTNVYFTLETLGKFYTDAAKAGGMQHWNGQIWSPSTSGPNIGSMESNYRPKQVTVVLYALRFPHNYIKTETFQSEEAAHQWNKISTAPNGQVIKLIEEV